MTEAHSKQFLIVRDALQRDEKEYTLDGKLCPACSHQTVIGLDSKRRYCTYERCNALVLEETKP